MYRIKPIFCEQKTNNNRGQHALFGAILEVTQGVEVVAFYEFDEILVVDLNGDVTHEGDVLYQPAGLSFRRVGGADQTPLAGVDSARTSDLQQREIAKKPTPLKCFFLISATFGDII